MIGSIYAGAARAELELIQGVGRFFGLHWASDVVVGWVAGGVWARSCIAVVQDEPRRPEPTGEQVDR